MSKTMTVTLSADDFKCKDIGAVYDEVDATVDAEVEPADRSVGIMSAHAYVNEVLTQAGGDVFELLTKDAIERLDEEYLRWLASEAEDAYLNEVDRRIKERKEEGV